MFCIHLCRSNLFSAIAAGILWKLNPWLFLREFVQPNAAQVATMMTLWKILLCSVSSSSSVVSPEHTNYNLLGRHVVDWPYNQRNVNGQRHTYLPSSTTSVCTEFKEISVDTYTENRVLRGDSRFINHDPVSTREESLKFQKQCQKLRQKTQVSILELTKLIGLLSSTIQAVLPAQINFRYL